MRAILALLALAPACATEGDTVTPDGTTILEWELAQSDRLTIRNATTSDRQQHAFEHEVPELAVRLDVELVAGTVRYYEAGRLETRTAPIELVLRVLDNGGHLIERAGCTGPHYDRGDEMVLTCDFNAFTLRVHGDGTVD